MALAETSDLKSDGRHGSVESRGKDAHFDSAPARASRRPTPPEPDSKASRWLEWARSPLASLLLKGSGILLLMSSLGAIGALATAKGLTPETQLKSARAEPSALPAAHADVVSPLPFTAAAMAEPPVAKSAEPPPSQAPSNGISADGRVILNLANAEELRKLPGVGRKRAEAIIALRQKLGRFKRVTDLLRVRGIGPKRLKQWLPLLLLDPPAGASSPAR